MSDLNSVRVALRVRPLSNSEIGQGHVSIVKLIPTTNGTQVQIHDGKNCSDHFTYTHTFDPSSTQQQVYDTALVDLLDKLFQGFNVTVLAYGQTCSGKTFTMGMDYRGKFDDTAGVVPRAVTDIFRIIETRTIAEKSAEPLTTVTCSFVELYQEHLFDLLSKNRQLVEIRDGCGLVMLQGLTEVEVNSVEQTLDCLMRGSTGRCVGATAMNSASSRSHAIFTINIAVQSPDNPRSVVKSKLHLVDLAGSERSKKTHAIGERFKESININKGLLALGNVISVLSSSGSISHVPYRDSKLTRLLQDSLGSNSYTLMIACVSPADCNKDETLSTLRYADRACKIKNKPVVNIDPERAYVIQLETTIAELRQKIVTLQQEGGVSEEHGTITESYYAMGLQLLNCKQEIERLQKKLQSTLQDLATAEMRALAAEKALEEIEIKFQALQKKESDVANTSAAFIGQLLTEYKLEKNALQTAPSDDKENSDDPESQELQSEVVQKATDDHTKQQLLKHKELREINHTLQWKEMLRRHCLEQGGGDSSGISVEVSDLRARLEDSEATIKSLEIQLAGNNLEIQLNEQADMAKTGKKALKLAEERRLRVCQLESKLAEMRQKSMVIQNQLKQKEKDSLRVVELTEEIKTMKTTRVQLLKSMRTDQEKFRNWRQNQAKEISQLKAKDAKRVQDFQKMESKILIQNQALSRRMDVEKRKLMRKIDELSTINRRMMASNKRRPVTVDPEELGPEALLCIEQDLELLYSSAQEIETIKALQKEREQLTEQLAQRKREADEASNDGNKAAVKKMCNDKIASLEHTLSLCTKAIEKLEQKQVSVKIDEQLDLLSDGIANRSDARDTIRHVLEMVLQKHMRCQDTSSVTKKKKSSILSKDHSIRDADGNPNCKKSKIVDRTFSIPEMEEEDNLKQEDDRLETETEADLVRDPTFRGTPLYKRKRLDSVVPRTAPSAPPACSCAGSCSTKRCRCKKSGYNCSDVCRCSFGCINKDSTPEESTTPSVASEEEIAHRSPKAAAAKSPAENVDKPAAADVEELDILTYVKRFKKRKPLIDL